MVSTLFDKRLVRYSKEYVESKSTKDERPQVSHYVEWLWQYP